MPMQAKNFSESEQLLEEKKSSISKGL